MSTEFIWQLPTAGDGRYGDAVRTRRGERSAGAGQRPPFTDGVTDPRGARFNYFDYLHQVARAADISGFDGLRIAHDLDGDDSWIVAGYLARGTRHIRLIAEFEASWGSAVYAAKNAVSFQRASGGRFAWQLSPGGDAESRRRNGDDVPEADVPARIDEFLTVARGVQTAAPYSFKGRFFEVQGGGFRGPLAGNPLPAVYLSGETPEALALSARQADVHLFDPAPADQLARSIAELQRLAAEQGRAVTAGLRIGVLARETTEEAERDAQRRQRQGTPALRGDLVGSYREVIDTLAAYGAAGIGSFVLGATPHLEEAYRIGEHVLPALRARLAQAGAADNLKAA